LVRGKFPVRGQPGAVGYLIGKPGEGLKCMFTLMNEARIGVGLGATMLGYAGYESLAGLCQGSPARPRHDGCWQRRQQSANCRSFSTATSSAC
jgi:alkylation response protein AidB-like acyl-CoA dehydrogenase